MSNRCIRDVLGLSSLQNALKVGRFVKSRLDTADVVLVHLVLIIDSWATTEHKIEQYIKPVGTFAVVLMIRRT